METRVLNFSHDTIIPQIKAIIDEGKTIRFRVRGWSMRIFVEHERDEVLLAPIGDSPIVMGDVILAHTTAGSYVLHRVVNINANLITLQGDGNVGAVEHCTHDKVIGRAIGFYRKGRQQPDLTSSRKWKVYSAIWLTLTPVRRYILAAYRRIWLKFFAPL